MSTKNVIYIKNKFMVKFLLKPSFRFLSIFCFIMSANEDAVVAEDTNIKDALQVSFQYPWIKLNNESYDNNISVSEEVLRKPSLDRHASFDSFSNLGASNSFNKGVFLPNLSSSFVQENVENCDLVDFQIQHEIQVQDKYIKEQFNLYRFKIIPDGNCMYRALAQGLAHDHNQHLVLRNEVVNYIKNNQKEYEAITEEPFEIFLQQAAKENSWGSYVELLAITKLLSINIIIVTGGSPSNPDVNVTCHHFNSDGDSVTPKDTVWLSWLSNGHYDVILSHPIKNEQYEEWLEERNKRLRTDAILAETLSTSQNFDDADEGIEQMLSDDLLEMQRCWCDQLTLCPNGQLEVCSFRKSERKAETKPKLPENSGTSSESSSQVQNPTEPSYSLYHPSLEEDEKLARNLQDAENVFALYGLTE